MTFAQCERHYRQVEVKFRLFNINTRAQVIDIEFNNEAEYAMFILREDPTLYRVGDELFIK